MRKLLGATGWRVFAATVVAVLSSLAASSVAHADHNNSGAFGTSFVDGAGVLTDDWGDQYSELGNSLCYGCADSWNTDLVIMWQAILFAEGFIGPYDIDGQFGPQTRDATKQWQSRYGLSVDGMVGPATWSRADQGLHWSGSGSLVRYDATGSGDVYFSRGDVNTYHDDGAYQLVNAWGSRLVDFASASHRVHFFSKTITVWFDQ